MDTMCTWNFKNPYVMKHMIEHEVTDLYEHSRSEQPSILLSTAPTVMAEGIHASLKERDWCVVAYDGTEFPGEITQIIGDELEVSVMHHRGKFFKWPETADKVMYDVVDVVRQLEGAPKVIMQGSQLAWKFPDFD